MSPNNRVETMTVDDNAASSDDGSILTTSTNEPIDATTQQISNDSESIDERATASIQEADSANVLMSAAGTAGCVGDTYGDANGSRDALTSAHEEEGIASDYQSFDATDSEKESNNLHSIVVQSGGEPGNSCGATNHAVGETNSSKCPPSAMMHPFDLPCPSKGKSGPIVKDGCQDANQNDSARSQPRYHSSLASVADNTSDVKPPNLEAKGCAVAKLTQPKPGSDFKEDSYLDLENQSTTDDCKVEKFGGTPSTTGLLTEEDQDDIDDALRPPELMRQDAASGLVWSVSQPGAFRQGGNGDEVEEEHDDWMMATQVIETQTTSVDDAHIIIHASAVLDDNIGEQEQLQQLVQQNSSVVLMGGRVEAIEVCDETQTPRTAPWQYNPPKPPRKIYAAFICIIMVAITVTIFVTVEVVNSTSGGSPANVPSPSPIGTIAPTSSELLGRSSSFNNETSTPPQHINVNPSPGSFVWASLGSELDGQFANQTMGYSISLSAVGYILAVGSPYTQDFSHPGSVSVFHLVDNSNWTLLGDVIPGKSNGEGFGWSVDISDSGETVAASAPVSGKGRVAVYQYDPVGSNWQQVGDDLVGDYDGQNFGWSVSLSGIGNIVASGAPGSANDTGLVAVYQFSGSIWEPMGSPISGSFVGQRFGGSVSLSLDGQTLAVGTIQHKCSKHIAHVRVFNWNGSDWQLMGNPINGTSANDQCAMSVSLSADGTTVAAGAWLSTSDANPQMITGNVLVFRWDLDHWEQLGSSIPGESEGGNFGVSVAISLDGNLLAAGANFAGKNGAGGVRVFRFNQTIGQWEPQGSIIKGEQASENFGKSVAISPGGRVVAGGAYMHSSQGIEDSGQVRVYTSF
jgi:hypothetical protein